MVKKMTILLVLFLMVTIVSSPLAFARKKIKSTEENLAEVEKVLKEIRSTPDLVSPDSILTATAIKALYYQNIQIMQLLEQMRDLLKQSLEKEEEKE